MATGVAQRTPDVPKRALGRLTDELLERATLEELHDAALHLDQPFLLQPRQQPADRLQLEAEIAADLLASHAQDEFRGRVAARAVALRKIEEKGREPLVGAHRTEEQHE